MNKEKHENEAAMEEAKAVVDQAAEMKERDAKRMAVLISQQG